MSKHRKIFLDKRLERVDDNRLIVKGLSHPETTIYANENVLVEKSAVDELLQVLQLDQTVAILKAKGILNSTAELLKVVATPDIHKGVGVPIGTVLQTQGFVVPGAIGSDIGCGMRLHATDWQAHLVPSYIGTLEAHFRHAFFEGGRNIPMTHDQREALFLHGLEGLLDAVPRTQEGLWRQFHTHAHERSRVTSCGSLDATRDEGLADFMGESGLTRDGQIGSIGGGNHFVEVQRVERVFDPVAAHEWGLKVGCVAVMVHTGSVAIGHLCAEQYNEAVIAVYPKGLKHPANKLYLIPGDGRQTGMYSKLETLFWNCFSNATNFAFANRMFLALMALDVLENTFGMTDTFLVRDSPHNVVVSTPHGYIHRKGACSAELGEPVIVPGSMGSSSFVLKGLGNTEALESASHGAGRCLSRGEALKGSNEAFEEFMRTYRVVTPVDFNRQDIRQRRDIVSKKMENIKAEGPHAYKDIIGVVETLKGAKIAEPVAELVPLMTIKG